MGSRLDLQAELESLLGSSNVYFQPPATLQMLYPCIVYQRADFNTIFANNNPYNFRKEYMVTSIVRDPDSDIPEKLASMPSSRFNRQYIADNLIHDAFTIIY